MKKKVKKKGPGQIKCGKTPTSGGADFRWRAIQERTKIRDLADYRPPRLDPPGVPLHITQRGESVRDFHRRRGSARTNSRSCWS
jgi:hypothetical protein